MTVAREQLVRALADQHDRNVAGCQLRDEMVRHGAVHERRVKGFQAGDDVGDQCNGVVGRIDLLVVVGAGELRHGASRREIGASLHTDRECFQPGTVLACPPGGDRRHYRRIHATGEQDADLGLGVQTPFDRADQRLADGVEHPGRRFLFGGAALQQHRNLGRLGARIDKAVVRRPDVPGRERRNQRSPIGVERLHLGSKECRVAATRPIERRNAEHVASDREPAVICGHDERVRPPQLVERGRADRVEERQGGLEVGIGVVVHVGQAGADAIVIVDLAVADHVGGAAGDRLAAVPRIGDRKVPASQPRVADLGRAHAVRTAVSQPTEHPVTESRIEGAVGCDYA